MKLYRIISLTAFCCLLTSCFKDEPLNAECDIEEVSVHAAKPSETFFYLSDTLRSVLSTEKNIIFNVRRKAEIGSYALTFKLTPGAVITPANGSVQDFSHGNVTYTVTSENGEWHRTYTIGFRPTVRTVNDTVQYNFENYYLQPKYKKFYMWHNEIAPGSWGDDWATGNPGFMLAAYSDPPENYPTVPEKNGYDGAAVRLTTRSTGTLGAAFGKPIAAGNFYLGYFNASESLTAPLKTTRFGIPFDKQPMKITGYYKYKPGQNFTGKDNKTIEGRTDKASIYGVFYRNHNDKGEVIYLYGNDVKTHSAIIGLADLKDIKPVTEWTPFEIEFKYPSEVDYDLLKNAGYNFTLVFSSSKDGDKFEGAVGSELIIDKVRVICKQENKNDR